MRGPVLVKAHDLSRFLSLIELSKSVNSNNPLPDFPSDLMSN